MLRRIANLVQKDIAKSLRDNIILYVLLSPILMTVGVALYLPSVQGMSLTFALDAAADPRVIEGFKEYGNVEVYDTHQALVERVERPDDVAGVVKRGDRHAVIVEGNETSDVGMMTGAVLDRVLGERPLAEIERVSLGRTRSMLKETFASFMALGAILTAGVLVGFAIIDEKETGVIRALAVSPTTMLEFISSHAVVTAIVSLTLAVVGSLILMGTGVSYARVVVGVLFSTGLGIVFGFLVGGLADNEISGIAVLKLVVLVFIGIPLASLFVPEVYRWVFYPFPNYWAFQIFQNIFSGEGALGFWGSCLVTLLFNAAVMIVLMPALRRRLRFR